MEQPEALAAAAPSGAARFKKRERSKHARSRGASSSEPAEEPPEDLERSAVVRPTKAAKPNPLVQGTASARKSATQDLLSVGVQPSDVRISTYDNKATATNEQDVPRDRDAQALYERAQQQWQDGGDVAADGSKVYRGQKAYYQYTGKAEDFTSQVMSGAGPARAPVHYRATSRFDYQPDICKDFRDTGFCGYGDACKFLHDRSDYKSGWQIEKQWEEQQKKKRHDEALVLMGEEEAKPKEEDSLPFACLICRELWHKASRPVVTKCEHYFCESCALRHFQKTRRCFVCAEQTAGIFNHAKAIQAKIDLREELQAAAAAPSEMTPELVAEYEASRKKSETRSLNAGWTYV
jgi:RING finger protein 113A